MQRLTLSYDEVGGKVNEIALPFTMARDHFARSYDGYDVIFELKLKMLFSYPKISGLVFFECSFLTFNEHQRRKCFNDFEASPLKLLHRCGLNYSN